MRNEHVSAFGGLAGRVVWGALSPINLILGVLFGIAIFVTGFVLGRLGGEVLALPASVVISAVLLARYALAGRAGELSGTPFSPAASSGPQTIGIAARYLALTAVWLVPLLLAGLDPLAVVSRLGRGGVGRGVTLFVLYLLGSIVTPPVFLIAAAAARDFRELASAGLWSRCFAGRLADLFVLYAVVLGGGAAIVLAALPAFLAVGSDSPGLLAAMAGGLLCYLGAWGTDSLGRLAGLYSLGEAPSAEPGVVSTRPAPPAATPGLPRGPRRAASPAVASGAATGSVPAGSRGGLAPLLQPREPLEQAWRRFETDAPGAIAQVEELDRCYAPNPHVLQALCLMRARAGDEPGAFEAGSRAVPLCLKRGHLRPAAQVFRALRGRARELGLDREQVLLLAGALAEMEDWKGAANAYATILAADPGESRAIEGTLAVAQALLEVASGAEDARKLYRYLLERAPTSPYAERIRSGLEASNRRVARSPGAASG